MTNFGITTSNSGASGAERDDILSGTSSGDDIDGFGGADEIYGLGGNDFTINTLH